MVYGAKQVVRISYELHNVMSLGSHPLYGRIVTDMYIHACARTHTRTHKSLLLLAQLSIYACRQ